MNRRNLYLMYAISLLQGLVFYGPIATLYRQAQGISVLQITLIESISLALCLALELPWGVIADKIGYKRSMCFCCMLYLVSKLVFWRATSFAAFLTERVMLSVVMAGVSGVDASILYLSCAPGQSQRAFSIYNALGTTGLLFAAVCYSAFIGTNYARAGLWTVISYGLAALLSLGLREVKAVEQRRMCPRDFLRLLGETLRNPYLLLFLVGIAAFNESHQTITVFLNQIQYVRAGMTPVLIGLVYLLATLAGLIGAASAKLTDRVGEARHMRLCFLGGAAACLALMLTGNPWISVGAILLFRVSFSLAQPLQTELQNRQITDSNRATALSIYAVIIDSVGVGTNLAFGALAESNLKYAFAFGTALCLTGVALYELWRRRRPEEK